MVAKPRWLTVKRVLSGVIISREPRLFRMRTYLDARLYSADSCLSADRPVIDEAVDLLNFAQSHTASIVTTIFTIVNCSGKK